MEPFPKMCWTTSLNTEHQESSLEVATAWMHNAQQQAQAAGTVVLAYKNMADRRLGPLGGFSTVSPRSKNGSRGGPTVVVWPPDGNTLSLASRDYTLVLQGRFDLRGWIEQYEATPLFDHDTIEPLSLSPEVIEMLERQAYWGGSNGFHGAGDKKTMIECLRKIHADHPNVSSKEIEQQLLSSVYVGAEAAKRAATWHTEIQEGKKHRTR